MDFQTINWQLLNLSLLSFLVEYELNMRAQHSTYIANQKEKRELITIVLLEPYFHLYMHVEEKGGLWQLAIHIYMNSISHRATMESICQFMEESYSVHM